MTVWNVHIMWALMLFGITLFTGCFIVVNRAMRGLRLCGLALAYASGAWKLATLPWKVAVTTWLVFAAIGGLIVFGYELWARRRYAGTGRQPRPLVLLQGFLLWRRTSTASRCPRSASSPSDRWTCSPAPVSSTAERRRDHA